MAGNPKDPKSSYKSEAERLLLDLVYQRHPSCHFTETMWAPPADVVVSEHAARVIFELAGVPREQVRVSLKGNTLEVPGRRDPPRDPEVTHYHRAEIRFGDFHRVVELPWEADPDKVDARYRDGMLEINLVPAASSRRTDVPIEKREQR